MFISLTLFCILMSFLRLYIYINLVINLGLLLLFNNIIFLQSLFVYTIQRSLEWLFQEKNKQGVEDMEFPGLSKK